MITTELVVMSMSFLLAISAHKNNKVNFRQQTCPTFVMRINDFIFGARL